jgi:hypothetical protein
MMKLAQAETPEQIEEVRRLLREYEASLAVSLCFQGFDMNHWASSALSPILIIQSQARFLCN